MKNILRRSKVTIFILIGAIVMATALQFFVFLLPTAPMEKNVKDSIQIFKSETVYREIIPGVYTTRLDNYTDACMLLGAIYNSEKPLHKRVMNVYTRMTEDMDYTDSLINYCETGKSDISHSYFWYWHGYMVVLKPLLLFFNYGDIRIFNIFGQLACLILFVLTLYRRGFKDYILPFGVAFVFLSPMTINLSMQFSACYYMMLLSSTALLYWKDYWEKDNKYWILFLLTGMGTSFFDLLTYPIVAIGLPLIVYFIINKSDSILHMVVRMIEYIFFWVFGYVAFWAGKWGVASIFLQKNCLIKALKKINQHTSMDAGGYVESFSMKEVFYKNFLWLQQKAYIALFVIVLIYLVIKIVRAGGIDKKGLKLSLPFVVIAVFPICWYIFASSHAYFHYWMEFRGCFLLLFGILAVLVRCRKEV